MTTWPPPEWEVDEFLARYPAFAIVPGTPDQLHVAGRLQQPAAGPDGAIVNLDYELEVRIHGSFPHSIPSVRETSGRIPRHFHTLVDGSACLGAELRLRSIARKRPTLRGFFEAAVLPYFYGHAYWLLNGRMPFGELPHGDAGVIEDLQALLHAADVSELHRLLVALSLRRRVANKRPCPCGSGVRLGRCHAARINGRRKLGPRSAFRAELLRLGHVAARRGMKSGQAGAPSEPVVTHVPA